MNVARFHRLLRTVLASTPVSGLVLLTASCSSETAMPERAQCIDPKSESRYATLTPSSAVDGIAFATRVPRTSNDPNAESPRPTRLPALGQPCSKATNAQACAERVAELLDDPSSQGWNVGSACSICDPQLLHDLAVITEGNDVRLATFDDLRRAVAPIETRDEAAALLLLQRRAIDCDQNNVRPEADGFTFKVTRRSCSGAVTEVFTKITRDGIVSEAGTNEVSGADNGCIEGRRPEGLAPTHVPWLSSVSACFSEIAHMESAAVLAFDDLEVRLLALGAPSSLLRRAAGARADEVAHAATTARLARRFGGKPIAPKLEGRRASNAESAWFELALENAVEGCVREAYGALVAAHQGAHASDAWVRAAFTQIALDEARHAELSFELDAWLALRLSPSERRTIEHAKQSAWRDLWVACGTEPAPEVVRVAGMPNARAARAMLTELHEISLAA